MFEVISSIPQSPEESITFDVRMKTGLAQAFNFDQKSKKIYEITFMDLAMFFQYKLLFRVIKFCNKSVTKI